MSHTGFDTILDECLARLAAGDSVDACLRKYPQQADELKPLLAVAANLRALPQPQPAPAAVEAGKQRMLTAHRQQGLAHGGAVSPHSRCLRRFWEFFLPKQGPQTTHLFRFAVAMLLVFFVGTNLAVIASAGSIPGDPLYGLKRSWEGARLTLAVRDEDHQRLQQEFLERREVEVGEMQRQGRQGMLEIDGVLQPLADGRWSIDGLAFRLSPQTRVEGELAAGAEAEARVRLLADGTLLALSVRGPLRALPLIVEPDPRRAPESSRQIPGGGQGHAPTPTAEDDLRRSPEAPPMPEPTSAPEPTGAPEPAETPEPDAAPEPEWTRCPACTAQPPEETMEPRHTPETHEPESTPPSRPTESPEPERTVRPTEIHEPDHTPEPARTHEPDRTPTPVPTGGPSHEVEPTPKAEHSPEPTHLPGAATSTPAGSHGTPEPGHTRVHSVAGDR
jgi:hypothetical protein